MNKCPITGAERFTMNTQKTVTTGNDEFEATVSVTRCEDPNVGNYFEITYAVDYGDHGETEKLTLPHHEAGELKRILASFGL